MGASLGVEGFQTLLGAEAARLALSHQAKLGILLEHAHAPALDAEVDGAADVRAFVPQQAEGLPQAVVDDIHSAPPRSGLIGVLDAEDVRCRHRAWPSCRCVIGRAQVANVHITRR